MAQTEAQKRRRRRRARGRGLSAGASSTTSGEAAEQVPAAVISAGRPRGGSGVGLSGDGWGGSVSDSALEDEEMEDGNRLQRVNQLKSSLPTKRKGKAGGAVSKDEPSGIRLSRSAELPLSSDHQSKKSWEEEEVEEDVIGDVDESRWVAEAPKTPTETSTTTSWDEELPELVGDDDDRGIVHENTVQQEPIDHRDSVKGDIGHDEDGSSRGRTRLRSSSSGMVEGHEPAPAATVKRTRARSQPPSKEAPDQVCLRRK